MAKLERSVQDFVQGGDGTLYHIGQRDDGEVIEYVVPESSQEVLLQAAHDGMMHLGRARTMSALRGSRMWCLHVLSGCRG